MDITLLSPVPGEILRLHSPRQIAFIEQADSRAVKPYEKLDWLNLSSAGFHEDYSQGIGVRFSWSGTAGQCILHLVCPYEDRRIPVSGTEAVVYNLFAGVTYRWQVICEGIGAESTFITADIAPRILHVDGIKNVRDFGVWRGCGGRRLKQGMLYRGSEMDVHESITPEGIRTMVDELRIRTDLDIRRQHEGHPVLPQDRVQWTLQSLLAYDAIDGSEQAAYLRKCFDLLLDPANYPIYVHCWGGADRTGTFFFLLDSLLGVSLDDLLLDFEITSLCIWGDRSRDMPEFRALVAYLQRYGEEGDSLQARSVAFLRSVGITDAEMEQLRELLLEK